MAVTRCSPSVRDANPAVEDLPPFHLTADTDSVPPIERRSSTTPDSSGAARHHGAGLHRQIDEPADDAKGGQAAKRRRRNQLITSAVTIIALVAVVYTLRGKLPSVGSVSTALTSAQPWWVVAAAVLETVSLAFFAFQQRALLRALEADMSVPRALGVTYARSAIAISMPAGSAVSAAFAYQQYRRGGASRDTAAAVMVLSGIASFAGLAILYVLGVAGVVVVSPEQAWHAHAELIIVVAACVVATAGVWLVAKRWPGRASRASRAEVVADSDQTRVRRWIATATASIRTNVASWRAVRPKHWAAALTLAVLNWLFDLLCLAAAAAAFGMHVGILTLASIYLGVQLVRQVPITPGGIGLIETGLLAGFAALGAPAATAAAVVLTYRVLSCWLLIPIGGAAWLGLRTARSAPATSPIDSAPRRELAATADAG